MAYSEDQKYWIWLASVHGLGVRRFDALIQGRKPQQIWEEMGAWTDALIGSQAYRALTAARNPQYFDRLFGELERIGAIAVTREDAEYPRYLRNVADAPPVLYVRGRAALSDARTLAIVGSRNCTAYGTRMARRMARDLTRSGVTVISGLARGIDSAAHRGAVDVQGRTIAVLGSGVDVIYPPEHRMLADEILECGGSIVSEQPPGASPRSQNFPARNRIISGMSEGLLLVEGAARSGTMSTVAYAAEQGREVLAVPGQADSPLSVSTHLLIRDGARLVTSAMDIFEDMGWQKQMKLKDSVEKPQTLNLPLTQAEQQVYNLLAGGPADTESLVESLRIPPPELNSLLTILELQGIIRKLPGRKVERIDQLED